MRCRILHETKGRMRVCLLKYRVTCSEADQLETYLLTVPEIRSAVVNERTGDAVITHSGDREAVIRALAEYDPETCTAEVTDRTGRELRRTYEDRFFWLIARRYAVKLLLPAPVRHLSLICKSWRFFREAFRCLGRKKLEVPVLDATTIAVSLLRQDYDTAGTIMFMLDAGGLLEEWTHKKSVDDLAKRMSLNVDKVWLKSGGSEVLVPVKEVREGGCDPCPHRKCDSSRRRGGRRRGRRQSGLDDRRVPSGAEEPGQLCLRRNSDGGGRDRRPREKCDGRRPL